MDVSDFGHGAPILGTPVVSRDSVIVVRVTSLSCCQSYDVIDGRNAVGGPWHTCFITAEVDECVECIISITIIYINVSRYYHQQVSTVPILIFFKSS
jgi:hypothetical protein